MIAYTVRIEVPSRRVDDYRKWMLETHLAEVLDAGADRGELVELDGGASFEARYVFSSREAFAAYERDHAPRLRADGLARFPLSEGFAYSRTLGELFSPTQRR